MVGHSVRFFTAPPGFVPASNSSISGPAGHQVSDRDSLISWVFIRLLAWSEVSEVVPNKPERYKKSQSFLVSFLSFCQQSYSIQYGPALMKRNRRRRIDCQRGCPENSNLNKSPPTLREGSQSRTEVSTKRTSR